MLRNGSDTRSAGNSNAEQSPLLTATTPLDLASIAQCNADKPQPG